MTVSSIELHISPDGRFIGVTFPGERTPGEGQPAIVSRITETAQFEGSNSYFGEGDSLVLTLDGPLDVNVHS